MLFVLGRINQNTRKMKNVNYFGKYAIFTIKSGKFINSFDSKKKAENELAKLNAKGTKYEIYHAKSITVHEC